jgi:hypothetical protein
VTSEKSILGFYFITKMRPSPDINQKIEESTNQIWVCLSPTFDFLSTIQTEIKNQRIEESQIEVEVVTTDR